MSARRSSFPWVEASNFFDFLTRVDVCERDEG